MTEQKMEEHEDEILDEAGDEETPAEEVELDEVDPLRIELAECQDMLLRQRADTDNIRKRLRKEADEAGNRAIARFVRPLLEEMDNFERALLAANPEQFQDFAMGVTMIKSNISNTFESSGIEIIPTDGVFDPHVHEVISEIEVAEQPRGTIVEVARSGYRLGGQVIRAAQVIVSRPPADESSDAE